MNKYLAFAIVAMGCASSASAITVTGSATVTCTEWVAAPGSYGDFDRDNTGMGFEAITLTVTDAVGTVLWSLSYNGGVPSTQTWSGATYSASPAYSPITFRVISNAGNGLPEQVAYQATGTCASVPTLAPVNVPTLDAAGLGTLAGLLGAAGVFWQRRRRTSKKAD
ncbi:IPTL-CTERM sorting domain-containing protein [Ottowia sp.]|uniref:IPTL-CTERM sorting domain-containing protein n=1 Tax=Ottowia sp. TaxID=1898956 RepID=UPI003A83CE25